MVYKLLYVEDLDPGSIISDLKDNGFEIKHSSPTTFEKIEKDISESEFDGILLDFRLTQGSNAVFDAPTIAQTQRTKSASTGRYFPIFLISTESNISSFYKDFTSSDLFDISVSKEHFQKNLTKYCGRLKDFIDSYNYINKVGFDLLQILDISRKDLDVLDYRLNERLGDPLMRVNTYKLSRLVYNTLIKLIGPLIGEDVLSARLGVAKTSEGWKKLLEAFESAKYKGVYSQSYNRWWASEIEKVCLEKFQIRGLRRLKAKEKTEHFSKLGFGQLSALEKLEFSESSNFWTICKQLKLPIDPIDGLELISKDTIPWQDKEYISMLAAMQSSDYLKIVKPGEYERFKEFVKTVK
jgi:hypothetical protein